MNSQTVRLLLLICLIFQFGCDITFKRKKINPEMTKVNSSQVDKKTDSEKKSEKEKTEITNTVNNRDAEIVMSYYSDPANAIIRKDMITHAQMSKKQLKNLVVGKLIPRDVQVVPLPLMLGKLLSPLPLHLVRVHVGTRVIVMNVNTRKILEVIKI